MKYSYEFKVKCVELYKQGKWPETPAGMNTKSFRHMIRDWVRLSEAQGIQVLMHAGTQKKWTAEEKYSLVAKVLNGCPNNRVALNAGINPGLLYSWVKKYKIEGYQGLAATRIGRPPKEPRMKKRSKPSDLTETEREELIRLREENEYLRTEQAVIKKLIALRLEKAAKLKARSQQSSENSEKKDIN